MEELYLQLRDENYCIKVINSNLDIECDSNTKKIVILIEKSSVNKYKENIIMNIPYFTEIRILILSQEDISLFEIIQDDRKMKDSIIFKD